MSFKQHISDKAVEYLGGAVLALAGLGALAYMDLRHITRVDWVQEQISDQELFIQQQSLYNKFGSQELTPARDQLILNATNRKSALERELEELR